jgi:hypothetical protein
MKTKKHGRRNKKAPPRLQHQEANPATSGPFAGLFRQVISAAFGRQLFVLAEGNPKAPAWRFYDRISGRTILTYMPHKRMIILGTDSVPCRDWLDAVGKAASWRDTGRFID